MQGNWTVPTPPAAHTLPAVADPNSQVAEADEMNNEATVGARLADLRVDVLYTSHGGGALTATARLANDGVLTASAPFSVAFRAADPLTGTLLGTAPVMGDLAAGDELTVTLALTQPVALAGLGDTLWAMADGGHAVVEADEANNTAYAFLGVLRDLRLAAADIRGSGPVTVTVHNGGFVMATDVLVVMLQEALTGTPLYGETLLYSDTLPAIAPGGVGIITATLAPGSYSLFVKADPSGAIPELDEGNNLAVREVLVPFRIYLPLVVRNLP